MKGSIFVFASDLNDEGYDRVLVNAKDRAGLQAVVLAGNYHHSRDLFPHNPVRKIQYLESEVFFQPDERSYAHTKLRPAVSRLVSERDPLKTLTAEAERRGMIVRVWTNNVHNSNLGSQNLDCVVQNVFGDPIITCLCPANPDVRAYICAISADIARYPIEGLMLETVCYMPYEHSYHHERTMLPLTPAQRFLMSLCFCPHCLDAARRGGVDSEHVRRAVRGELEKVLEGDRSAVDDTALQLDQISALADGAMGQFLAARQQVVTTLVSDIVVAVHHQRDIPVLFIDSSGGLRGAGSGMSVAASAAPAPERAWQDGIDVRAVADKSSGLAVLGYTSDSAGLRTDLAAYRKLLPSQRSLAIALRAMPPDAQKADDLVRLVGVANEFQPEWVDFYHYAMMRLSNLDWIRSAMASQNAA